MPLDSLWEGQSPACDSHGSSRSSRSSHSSSSEDGGNSQSDGTNAADSDDDAENDADAFKDLQKKMRRQAQTAKARVAALQAKERKRIARFSMLPEIIERHPAERFREDLNAESLINKPGGSSSLQRTRMRRLRLAVSYLKGWCANLLNCFNTWGDRVEHTILTAVTDDTAVKLRPDKEGLPTDAPRQSRAVSVMNTMQSLTVCYTCDGVESEQNRGNGSRCKLFPIVTPLSVIPKADRDGISTVFRSRLFSFCGKVSKRYKQFGLQNLMKTVPIQGLVIVVDSLKTNVAMLKLFRERTHAHHQQREKASQDETLHPLFSLFCGLHQLSLARSAILFHFQGVWSSLVRLAHLFGNQGFRSQFQQALIQVICADFVLYSVPELPSEVRGWQSRRAKVYRLCSRTLKVKRLRLHQALAVFDNGNPDSSAFTHYCTGHCCEGGTREEKQLFALSQMTKLYALLFSTGFPVPLTYRWVHGEIALDYLQETRMLWHWHWLSG